VPKKRGERIKTDRRDARKLLALLKAGLLTEVHAPDKEQEAVRELGRLRQTAKENVMRIRHQISKFLLRHGYIYAEGKHWTKKHNQWLGTIKFEDLLLQEVYENYLVELGHCVARLDELNKRIEKAASSKEYAEMIGVVRCFYGIDTISAFGIITEIFEFGRFASAGEFMSYLGLVPSEDSSGQKQRKGPITKSGNKRVRRLLTEAAHHYRHPFATSAALAARRKDQPLWAIDIADKAGKRLRRRYEHLLRRGINHNTIVVAIARELAGFILSMMKSYLAHKQQEAA
jgi:transposase